MSHKPGRWRKRHDHLYTRTLGPIDLRVSFNGHHGGWSWEVRVPGRHGYGGMSLGCAILIDELLPDVRAAKRMAETKAAQILAPAFTALHALPTTAR